MLDGALDESFLGMMLQDDRSVEPLRKRLEAEEAEAMQIAADLREELEHEKAEAQRLQVRLNESEEEAIRQTAAAKSDAAALQEELDMARPPTFASSPAECAAPPIVVPMLSFRPHSGYGLDML